VEQALRAMREHDRTTVVVVEVDKWESVPGYESWWDVPMSEVSQIESIRLAREGYDEALKKERHSTTLRRSETCATSEVGSGEAAR
jgi:3D-(3,5/4)-trihydroxycyclohexane-1,2-dione acylhydrolase (decyclizing)